VPCNPHGNDIRKVKSDKSVIGRATSGRCLPRHDYAVPDRWPTAQLANGREQCDIVA
jgi:hypothetical protein